MKGEDRSNREELVRYQTRKLQELMNELMECCGDKTSLQSKMLDLPAAEIGCLRLFNGERYLTAKAIAQRLGVAKSRVTKIVGGLIRKRLAERVVDPKDSRVKLISLTRSGLEKCREIDQVLSVNPRALLLALSPEERPRVISALELLRTAMEGIK